MSPPFLLEKNFFANTDILNQQIQEQLGFPLSGVSPLQYAFREGMYAFLTARSEQIFGQAVLESLMARLRVWSSAALGTSRVSDPQLRVYINGCWRSLLRDSIPGEWHFILCLKDVDDSLAKGGAMTLVTAEEKQQTSTAALTISSTARYHLKSNDLFVHPIGSAYGIDVTKGSMNPLDGQLLIDGYFS